MSKTKGNVIDPLEVIDEFGADAVRFALAAAASSGPTVSLEKHRLAGSRAFATKLWNASRFALGQWEAERPGESRSGRRWSCRTAGSSRASRPRRRRSPGSSRSSASTRRRRRSTPSSGTSSATGTSRWSSRASRAARRRPESRTAARETLARCLDGLARAAPSLHAVRDRGDLGEADGPAAR